MSVTVLCVGKMKEKPYRAMADEYLGDYVPADDIKDKYDIR